MGTTPSFAGARTSGTKRRRRTETRTLQNSGALSRTKGNESSWHGGRICCTRPAWPSKRSTSGWRGKLQIFGSVAGRRSEGGGQLVLVELPPLRPWAAGSDWSPMISFWCPAKLKSKHSVRVISGFGYGSQCLSKQRRDILKVSNYRRSLCFSCCVFLHFSHFCRSSSRSKTKSVYIFYEQRSAEHAGKKRHLVHEL